MTTSYFNHWRDVPASAWRWPNFSAAEIACRGTGAIKINTAVQTAQVAGPAFTINWTAQDDTDVTMDQAAMFGMPAALATYANALHIAYRTHKVVINEADFDTLLTYDVNAGWPT